jgi:hypothetical protein
MTQMNNVMENALADFVRGQGITLPAAWYLTPLSAWTESTATEITGVGLARVSKARSLANFAGTQSDGSTLASSGTSHSTSNNTTIPFGTASGSATMSHVGFYDQASGGQCWAAWQLETPLAIANTDVVTMAVSQVKFSLGMSGGVSDFLANALVDLIFRGQTYAFPSLVYFGLFTAAPSNAGGGTEIGGGVGYSRTSLVPSLTSLSGTQSAGSTVASSGTGGRVSNNAAVTFPQPSGSWGTPAWAGIFDAASAGNLLFHRSLASPSSIGASSPPPSFAPNALGISFA